jgi:hypothetical protein
MRRPTISGSSPSLDNAVFWHAVVQPLVVPYAAVSFLFPIPCITYTLRLGILLLSLLFLYRSGVRLTNPFRPSLRRAPA